MEPALSRAAPVIFKKAVPSTNTVLKQLIPMSPPEGLVLTAARQLSGRGRLGRSFESPEGGLYLSMLLYPQCSPESLGSLTPCAAVAARRAIEHCCGLSCGIKWPNDLLFKGKKLCGILTEVSFFRDKCCVVLGVGINVNSDIAAFPAELYESACSLAGALGRKLELEALARTLIEELDLMYSRWKAEPGAFLAEYRAHCVSLGRDVLLQRGEEKREAFALDVDGSYALIVDIDGKKERVFMGEASLREK